MEKGKENGKELLSWAGRGGNGNRSIQNRKKIEKKNKKQNKKIFTWHIRWKIQKRNNFPFMILYRRTKIKFKTI